MDSRSNCWEVSQLTLSNPAGAKLGPCAPGLEISGLDMPLPC